MRSANGGKISQGLVLIKGKVEKESITVSFGKEKGAMY